MNSKLLELLKQDIAKWEEAATALDALLPQLAEGERKQWQSRAGHYRENARVMREVLPKVIS
ncbi:MAG TPA: hypothetical protein VN682_05525 [Terriglobales bacterium]|nr:hypothetical protein [Terriglobales bacterium]HXF13460.1 hypothetical protein [Terriglobales bacterium]